MRRADKSRTPAGRTLPTRNVSLVRMNRNPSDTGARLRNAGRKNLNSSSPAAMPAQEVRTNAIVKSLGYHHRSHADWWDQWNKWKYTQLTRRSTDQRNHLSKNLDGANS